MRFVHAGILVAGAAMIVSGVALWSIPAALVVGGAMALAAAWDMAR